MDPGSRSFKRKTLSYWILKQVQNDGLSALRRFINRMKACINGNSNDTKDNTMNFIRVKACENKHGKAAFEGFQMDF